MGSRKDNDLRSVMKSREDALREVEKLVKHTEALERKYTEKVSVYPSKALFSSDPDNLQLHCVLGLGTLLCCLFLSSRPTM